MKQVFLIFIGGGLGSIGRYAFSKYLNIYGFFMPYGTFISNVIGCLLIGFVLGLVSRGNLLNPNQTLFLTTGLCGGFTTFSAFTYENYFYFKEGNIIQMLSYLFLSLTAGFVSIIIGVYLSRML